MTKILSVIIVLLIIMFAPAAPSDPATPTAALHANEARTYAAQLTQVINKISTKYVRPVPRTRLFFTALTALYDQAGRSVPATLMGDLARALHELPGDGEETEATERPITPGDLPIVELVARHRQELGDLEALRGSWALRLSVEAILESLDPFCGLVSDEEVRRGRGENLNHGFGFAWSADSTAEELRVTAVPIGGPAQRAGIRPGDRLTNLRYQPARLARQPQPAVGLPGLLLLAQPGDPLECTVQRTGATVTLYYEHFQVQSVFGVRRHNDDSWCHWLDENEKIGYARLGSLDFGVADQLRQAILRLKQDGLRGLVLDLRWCPGGFLSEAVLTANLFLKEGQIALVPLPRQPQRRRAQRLGKHGLLHRPAAGDLDERRQLGRRRADRLRLAGPWQGRGGRPAHPWQGQRAGHLRRSAHQYQADDRPVLSAQWPAIAASRRRSARRPVGRPPGSRPGAADHAGPERQAARRVGPDRLAARPQQGSAVPGRSGERSAAAGGASQAMREHLRK